MEAAGIALGIAGLAGIFSACLEGYHLVQRSISFHKDYRILRTKFENQELRLYSWGIACGLTGDLSYDNQLDTAELHSRVAATLQCIRTLIQDQIDLRNKYESVPTQLHNGEGESALLAADGTETTSKLSVRSSLGTFFRRRKQQLTLGVTDTARWAIEDHARFSELIQHLKDFNDDLEALTRLTNVASRQRIIVEYEIEEIEDVEILVDIEEAGHDGSDIISETASVRLASIREGSIRTSSSLYTRSSASFRTARSALSIQERLSIELGHERILQLAASADAGTDVRSPADERIESRAAALNATETQVPTPGSMIPVLATPSSKGRATFDPNCTYKVLAIGSHNSGTTALLNAFAHGYWPTGHRPSDFKDYVSECRVDSTPMKLLLVDTAGEEDYSLLRKNRFAKSEVILLCFNANLLFAETLIDLENTWLADIDLLHKVPVILVGIRDPDLDERETNDRKFEQQVRQRFAVRIGASRYMWCDPLTGDGVDDVFEAAARAILNNYNLPKQPRKQSRLSTLFRNLRAVTEEPEIVAS